MLTAGLVDPWRASGLCTVDLDYYNVPKWRASEPRDVLASVLTALEKIGIPAPGLAVATGRGLQLVWVITPVKLQAAPKANTAMQRLTKVLVDFGADPACTDLARVFRIPGTVNSKNGKVARLLIHEPHRHDFDYLCRTILGERVRGSPNRERSRGKATGNRSIVHKRLSELQQIVLGRWGGKVPKGYRNLVAHLAAVHLIQLPGDALDNVIRWCAKWTDGHLEAEIRRTVKTALKKRYRYTGRRIGEKLNVTAEEACRFQLTTIYAQNETAQEHVTRRRTEKAAAERRRRSEAGAKPHAESAQRKQPWNSLGISRATYYRRKSFKPRETDSCHLHSGLGGTCDRDAPSPLRRA